MITLLVEMERERWKQGVRGNRMDGATPDCVGVKGNRDENRRRGSQSL